MAFTHDGPIRGFRIADRRHAIFDGTGTFLKGARWTSKNQRVIYAAESYAGALLEILVHSNIGRAPRNDSWIEITVPASVARETVKPQDVPGWDDPDWVASRQHGDLWCRERRTAVLIVPSLVTRGVEHNILLNQNHPMFARISAGQSGEVYWDQRLFGAT